MIRKNLSIADLTLPDETRISDSKWPLFHNQDMSINRIPYFIDKKNVS